MKALLWLLCMCIIHPFYSEMSLLSEKEIDAIANEALSLFSVPGMSLGIVVQDKVILSRGYGVRRVGESLPVTDQTLFCIGSSTKAFTAFILCQLAEEGKVSLDDPVQRYIPEFSLLNAEDARLLTIADLLAHRTGIWRHDPIWVHSDFPPAEVLKLLKYLEPACGIREKFQYNNLMYTVAALVIEKVTGQSWEEALCSRVFKPLGMNHSTADLNQVKRCDNYSHPHAELKGNHQVVPFDPLTSCSAAGGIYASTSDVIKWMQMQLDTSAHKRVLQEMQSMQMPLSQALPLEKNLSLSGYGFGWFLGKHRAKEEILWHGGNINGFVSDVLLFPQEKIGIVLLTNSSSDGTYAISYVRNKILNKLFQLEESYLTDESVQARKETKQKLDEAVHTFEQANQQIHTEDVLEPYIGSYEHPGYGTLRISNSNGRLVAQYGKSLVPLAFKQKDCFIGYAEVLIFYEVDPLCEFSFVRNEAGRVVGLQVPFEGFRGGKPISFTRK